MPGLKGAKREAKKRTRQVEFQDVDANMPLQPTSPSIPAIPTTEERVKRQRMEAMPAPEIRPQGDEQVLKRVYTKPQVRCGLTCGLGKLMFIRYALGRICCHRQISPEVW